MCVYTYIYIYTQLRASGLPADRQASSRATCTTTTTNNNNHNHNNNDNNHIIVILSSPFSPLLSSPIPSSLAIARLKERPLKYFMFLVVFGCYCYLSGETHNDTRRVRRRSENSESEFCTGSESERPLKSFQSSTHPGDVRKSNKTT